MSTRIVTVVPLVLFAAYAQALDFRAQVERDWLSQETLRAPDTGAITTESDAAGVCDGVKDGRWGCHTAHEAAPWWQVDLEASRVVNRVLVWNRCDGSSERAARLRVLLSDDGTTWRAVYVHDGVVFHGFTDNKPLEIVLSDETARFVRVQLPDTDYLHLDEVEVFGPSAPEMNLALGRPANQSSTSQWSSGHQPAPRVNWTERARAVLADCRRLLAEREAAGVDFAEIEGAVREQARRLEHGKSGKQAYLRARWLRRRLALAHPSLDFDSILLTKRVPGSFNHMSDQYYGWWSRPGGGLYMLTGFREDAPQVECITTAFGEGGSFLRPAIDYEARKVLFAWCRHYPGLADEPDKLNKANVPEDAFFHLFEMDLDGGAPRQLTHGKYDDFDGRYLPDGRIVFLSTRRGQATQCGAAGAPPPDRPDLPDAYVRCGGGPERPVAVYTLHTMDADGADVCAISPFEMFEWTPSVARDGTILFARWDYIDRDNMPYMSLWSCRPDGTHPRLVYGNHTHAPHCVFEAQSIPNSDRVIFTASGHHAQTLGSLVLLDPAVGAEGAAPITRLTPEIPFPEIEGWPKSFFANPWPLSETRYLVAWGPEKTPGQGQSRAHNAMGVYFFEASGFMELLYRDPEITCEDPIAVQPRPRPPAIPDMRAGGAVAEGRFLLQDVYEGLDATAPGAVKALRIVAVPPKTHPTMNAPNLGLIGDDPGKCVLGVVPVEPDGSAHFHAPAGVTLFFQALDERGMAIRTMRSATYLQPGQTLACVGCHESRHMAPPARRSLAARRAPSRITPGPNGSWPFRFDALVQPVLDRHCVTCHRPDSDRPDAARVNLTAAVAYETLTQFGEPSLAQQVLAQYREGSSKEGEGLAANSALLAMLTAPGGHHEVALSGGELARFITWIDVYAQRLGSFSAEQEAELIALRERWAGILETAASVARASRP